ncbi:MAG: AbrB/MazE/SpoVT family DNA-binding domain-containing protein [Rubrivivax sp.]|nr:AbrB/MazE/SpoVT family DNA-binding domain-containing protein [Rubrivivax sp.]
MSLISVSSKGQIVLPAPLRRKLGLGTGSQLEVVEAADGLHLRVVRAVPKQSVAEVAGKFKAPTAGKPRSLFDFNAADYATLGAKPKRSR